jgi:hypothetical protein
MSAFDRRFADVPVLEKPVELKLLEEIFGRVHENTFQRQIARTA